MKISIYPMPQLDALWQTDKALFDPEATSPPQCLRCGYTLDRRLIANPLSRYADIHICRCCGSDEAVRDMSGKPLPFTEWDAAKNGRLPVLDNKRFTVLKTKCDFSHVYEQTKKIPLSSTEHPVSEVVYSRSDYDGQKWWTTWFDCQEDKPEWELIQEIDGFHNSLFAMPEIRNLDTMRKLCVFAEHTDCDSEFNFYSETAHFYIWMRLITRFKDYNLYVHYYLK